MALRRHLALLVLLVLLVLSGCKSSRAEIVVLAASSLARAFSGLEEVLERAHPELEVKLTINGSQAVCRQLAELGGRADVVATADYQNIDDILRPGFADYNIHFTSNELVLAHLQHSRHTDEVTAENWPRLLQRKEVQLGLVDPDLAPIGYRTLLLWQLAEQQLGVERLASRLRGKVAAEHLAPHETELLQLLQSQAIDYAFLYRSTAEDANLKVVALPAAYNLGATDAANRQRYARAHVEVLLSRRRQSIAGAPAIYGVTIPREPLNAAGAELFVRALLGEQGQRELQRVGFSPLVPARCSERARLPLSLRSLVR